MKNIVKYFESSKKRDLSDGSKTSEEPKKLCRGILLNFLKNLEKDVKTVRSLVDQNRQTQTKIEQSPGDL